MINISIISILLCLFTSDTYHGACKNNKSNLVFWDNMTTKRDIRLEKKRKKNLHYLAYDRLGTLKVFLL